MNLRQLIVFRRGGAESRPDNQPRFHLPLSTQWSGAWGVRLLALSLLLASCSGLAGEPQIVSTLPPATATPALTPPTTMPDIALGAQVFADNCTRCHGTSGKGDGELVQSGQVPSPGDFTNPMTSGAQPPLGYYSVITNGNLDKLMPPWANALSEQERWSVALYTYTLSITPDQIARGRDLFNADCADCDVSALTSLDATANLSRDKLIAAVGDLPGFASLSDSERADAAAYIRSLALASPDAIGSVAAPATAEASSTEAPSAASTMEPAAAVGTLSGQVTNGSAGSTVPADLPLTLFIFDADFNQQQFTTTADPTGAYSFSDVPLDASYQYVVTANYRDRVFASDILNGDALTTDMTDGSLSLPLTIYELTEDADVIQLAGLVTQVSVSSGSLEIAQVYNFTNTSDRAYTTSQTTDDGRAISLAITLPPGAMIAGFPSDQNRFVVDATNETFYDTVPVLPGEQHIIQVIYLIQYDQGAIIEQPINYAISAPVRLLLTPQNIKVTSDQLPPLGPQTLGSTRVRELRRAAFAANGIGLALRIERHRRRQSGASSRQFEQPCAADRRCSRDRAADRRRGIPDRPPQPLRRRAGEKHPDPPDRRTRRRARRGQNRRRELRTPARGAQSPPCRPDGARAIDSQTHSQGRSVRVFKNPSPRTQSVLPLSHVNGARGDVPPSPRLCGRRGLGG